MKKTLFLLFVIVAAACGSSNDPQPSSPAKTAYCTRTGAMCKDGSRSTATGSGACSSHGGVNYWLCQ